MKKLILPAFLALSTLFASCSKYQVNVLSSPNTTKNPQTGNFDFENDSVKISYSFYGINAPVDIQVYNKLDKPLYIDWQRSAVIIGDKAVSYASNKITIDGSIEAYTNTFRLGRDNIWGDPSFTNGSINAVATLPKDVMFLPPHSQANSVTVHLTNGYLSIADSALRREEATYRDDFAARKLSVKSANFTRENSPMLFKSYLTLYTVNNNEIRPVAYQQDFYVSRTVTTISDPKHFDEFTQKRGDYFINTKRTGYGKFMMGAGVAAVIVGGSALSNAAGGGHQGN